MIHVLSAIVPVFLIVAAGFLSTKTGLFRREDMSVLSRFVVKVALPTLVFVSVAGRAAREIFQPVFLLTYGGIFVTMTGLAQLYVRLCKRPRRRGAWFGTSMSGTNNGFIGLPILLILVPDWAGAAAGMGMLVDNVFIIPLTLLLLSLTQGGSSASERVWKNLVNVARHPLVIAIVLALVFSSLQWSLPPVLATSVQLLANTTSGVALFTIGGMLVGAQLSGAKVDIVVASVGKLIVAPLVAVGLAILLPMLGLPALPDELRTALVILCGLSGYSILPPMMEPYGDEASVATGVVMTQTVLSFFTLSGLVLALSAVGWLPAA